MISNNTMTTVNEGDTLMVCVEMSSEGGALSREVIVSLSTPEITGEH